MARGPLEVEATQVARHDGRHPQRDPTRFFGQHVDDFLRRPVAKQLTMIALVAGDNVFFDEGDEVVRRVAVQGRDTETRIVRQKIQRRGVKVGEIGTATIGDTDLFPRVFSALQDENATAAPGRFDHAHQTGGTCADDDEIEVRHP